MICLTCQKQILRTTSVGMLQLMIIFVLKKLYSFWFSCLLLLLLISKVFTQFFYSGIDLSIGMSISISIVVVILIIIRLSL